MGLFRNLKIRYDTANLVDSFERICGRFVEPDDVNTLYKVVTTFFSQHGIPDYTSLVGLYGIQLFGDVYSQARQDTPDLLFVRVVSFAIETVLQFRRKRQLTRDEWLVMNESLWKEIYRYGRFRR